MIQSNIDSFLKYSEAKKDDLPQKTHMTYTDLPVGRQIHLNI